MARALIVNLAVAGTLGADHTCTLTDLTLAVSDFAIAVTDDLTLTLTLTLTIAVPVADLAVTLAHADLTLAVAAVPVANTIANLVITNIADAGLPVTLLAVRIVAWSLAHAVWWHGTWAWPYALCSPTSRSRPGIAEGDAGRLAAFLGGTIGNLLV
jgi:hypothetical protein